MKTISIFEIFVGLALFAAHAASLASDESDYNFKDGNALLSVCGEFVAAFDKNARLSERELASHLACSSYLRGFSHGVALVSKEPEQGYGYCLDERLSVIQIARVVVKSLKESPSVLHYHPAPLVAQALRKAFPCQ